MARRDYSALELRQKLLGKGYDEALVLPILDEFKTSRLIDDKRFAEQYCYWRRQKGFGPRRIQYELKSRGIPGEIIAELIKITDNAWVEKAKEVWQKHFKKATQPDSKMHAKQIRFLLYRGFTQEQIEPIFE